MNRITWLYLSALAGSQNFDQSQVEALCGNACDVMIVFVFTVVAVAGNLIIRGEVIVSRIIVRCRIYIVLRIVVLVCCTGNFRKVVNLQTCRKRVVQSQIYAHFDRITWQQSTCC